MHRCEDRHLYKILVNLALEGPINHHCQNLYNLLGNLHHPIGSAFCEGRDEDIVLGRDVAGKRLFLGRLGTHSLKAELDDVFGETEALDDVAESLVDAGPVSGVARLGREIEQSIHGVLARPLAESRDRSDRRAASLCRRRRSLRRPTACCVRRRRDRSGEPTSLRWRSLRRPEGSTRSR